MVANPLISVLVFFLVIFLIILGFKKPRSVKKANRIRLDYGTAPILGVIILLITFSINLDTVFIGIVGNEAIRPYSIIILFMSLAYICISIDITGFFEYLALKVLNAAGNSGRRLFIYFFFFSSFLTIFTSNDIVILTITPIIIYFSRHAKINPFPYLIAQFFAANIWSITLFIGNPTNIIVAEAYDLNFIEYIKWTLIPTITAGLTCLALLYIIFKKVIPKDINIPQIDPNSAIKDKKGAIFGTFCLIFCLLMLSIAPLYNISLWIITSIFAFLMLFYNIIHQFMIKKNQKTINYNLLKNSSSRMPWKIMFFISGMFILVESLVMSGWVDLLASFISSFSNNLILSILLMSFLTSLACNIMNNQPMTILFTQVLLSTSLETTEIIKFGLMFSLIMGSNFGANFTPIGALAGIMWQKIAKDKEIQISFKEFAKYGFIVIPIVILTASFILSLEILFWFK